MKMESEYGYSKTKNAFYDLSRKALFIAAGTWPDDVVGIDMSIVQEFIQTPPDGKKRIAGADGMPAWGDIPPPGRDDLISFAEMDKQQRINQANSYMNSKQWPGKAAMGRLSKDDQAKYGMWLDYLDALEAVNTSTAPDIAWPDLAQ